MNKSSRRTTPPETPEEWQQYWEDREYIERSRPFLSPLVAVGENWKALLIVATMVLMIQSPRIIAAIEVLAGQGR